MSRRSWTAEEDGFLLASVGHIAARSVAEKLNRTEQSVYKRARRLGAPFDGGRQRTEPRRPSHVEVRDGLIFVAANNTGRQHVFNYSPTLLEQLQGKAWREDHYGYLVRMITDWSSRPWRRTVAFAFHLVLPKRTGLDVDHINRDRRDNRRENLRYLPHAHNSFNCGLKGSNRSGVTGVAWDKRRGKWRARIMVNRRDIFLGYFGSKEDAIVTRKRAETQYFPGVLPIGGERVG